VTTNANAVDHKLLAWMKSMSPLERLEHLQDNISDIPGDSQGLHLISAEGPVRFIGNENYLLEILREMQNLDD